MNIRANSCFIITVAKMYRSYTRIICILIRKRCCRILLLLWVRSKTNSFVEFSFINYKDSRRCNTYINDSSRKMRSKFQGLVEWSRRYLWRQVLKIWNFSSIKIYCLLLICIIQDLV